MTARERFRYLLDEIDKCNAIRDTADKWSSEYDLATDRLDALEAELDKTEIRIMPREE
jgi:hypothetical protein